MNNTPYNYSFACIDCRKSFKRVFEKDRAYTRKLPCPECGNDSYNLGRHFKAPKKLDIKQWEKVSFLIQNGFYFQKIRPTKNSLESAPYPETLNDAKEFVEQYKEFAILDE